MTKELDFTTPEEDGYRVVKFGVKTATICPSEEIAAIDALAASRQATAGQQFVETIRERIYEMTGGEKDKGVRVSSGAAWAYYLTLVKADAEIKTFFAKRLGLPATSGSTPGNSTEPKSPRTSRTSRASRRKSRSGGSGTKKKISKSGGTG